MGVGTRWQKRRAMGRVQPGDGRVLQGFRWWQLPGRALLSIALPANDLPTREYSVDIRHWQRQGSGDVVAQLFVDGRQRATSKIPAVFTVDGGVIEVAMSRLGLKRCHFVADDGTQRQLIPDPKSAEGRRQRFDDGHPIASRVISVMSSALLVIGVLLVALKLAEPLSRIPAVATTVGVFDSPIALSPYATVALGVAAVAAGVERSLRLRYHWLLDGAGS